jgi:hypothetical protein
MVDMTLVDDHLELRPLPDDPIELLTGIFKDQPHSLSDELLRERKRITTLTKRVVFDAHAILRWTVSV